MGEPDNVYETALLAIAYMDVLTRPREQPAHEVMREIALTALTQVEEAKA